MSEKSIAERIKKLQDKIEQLEYELVCEGEEVERKYLRNRIKKIRERIKELEQEDS